MEIGYISHIPIIKSLRRKIRKFVAHILRIYLTYMTYKTYETYPAHPAPKLANTLFINLTFFGADTPSATLIFNKPSPISLVRGSILSKSHFISASWRILIYLKVLKRARNVYIPGPGGREKWGLNFHQHIHLPEFVQLPHSRQWR